MDGYRDKNGKKDQLGFQAFFVPTFAGNGKGTMFSQFPAADFPVLALNGTTAASVSTPVCRRTSANPA